MREPLSPHPRAFLHAQGSRAAENPFLTLSDRPPSVRCSHQPTELEQQRGFVLFQTPPSLLMGEAVRLEAAFRTDRLSTREAPGQCWVITFSLLSLRDLSVAITFPDPATAQSCECRIARYNTRDGGSYPLLLERFERAAIPARCLQPFQLTAEVPPGREPGTWSLSLAIASAPDRTDVIPVEIDVLPFVLSDNRRRYIYTELPGSPERLRLQLADQCAHAMNTSLLFTMPVDGDGNLTRDALTPWLDVYADAGLSRPEFQCEFDDKIICEWLDEPDSTTEPPMYAPWFRFFPHSGTLDDRYVAAVRLLRDELRARGLDLILGVTDECGSHPWTIPAAQHYFDLVKAKLPDVTRELTVGGGWAMGEPEHDHWAGRVQLWTSNRWLPDRFDLARENDPTVRFQIYNMGGPGSSPGGLQAARCVYGFFPWKAGVEGVGQWVYHHAKTPEHNYTWPSASEKEGHVPTLRWEAVREGAKDGMAADTLEQMVAGRSDSAATAARELLMDIRSSIVLRTDEYDPVHGGRVPAHAPGTYEAWRGEIIDQVLEVRDWD